MVSGVTSSSTSLPFYACLVTLVHQTTGIKSRVPALVYPCITERYNSVTKGHSVQSFQDLCLCYSSAIQGPSSRRRLTELFVRLHSGLHRRRCVAIHFLPYMFWKLGQSGMTSEPLLHPVEPAADNDDSGSITWSTPALLSCIEGLGMTPYCGSQKGSVFDVGRPSVKVWLIRHCLVNKGCLGEKKSASST